MENIGLCKRDMAVLPQRQALAASPFASLAFAQAILERNNTATGLYTPLHLIYAPEEAQAAAPAPSVQVDLHLTLPAEKQPKAKKEQPGERTVETMTERMVERILRERFTMERSVIRQAAPTIQNVYHTSVRAALARRETFLQGPVAQAQAMAKVAAARQKAPEPVQLRYAQVLRRNQEAGLTASTRAPLERQAFPPARTAASTTGPTAQTAPAKAGGPQAWAQDQGARAPISPARAAQPGRAGASQAQPGGIAAQEETMGQNPMPQAVASSPVGQAAGADMAPLVLQQAALPDRSEQPGAPLGGQPIQRESIPASQPVQPAPFSQPVAPQAAAEGTALARAIQEQPSSSLTSPAAMTHRQDEAASTQPGPVPTQPATRQAAQPAVQGASGRPAARQAETAQGTQAGSQPPIDASSREKAGAAQRAQREAQARPKATAAAEAPAEKQASEKQPPTGQDIEGHRAAHPGPGQSVAAGEGTQPQGVDSQPVMAQRALGQVAEPVPMGEALQYAPVQEPGQTPEPRSAPWQRAEAAERPVAKAATTKRMEESQAAKEEARQATKGGARQTAQAEVKKAAQPAVAGEIPQQAATAQANQAPQETTQAETQPAPMAQAPAQPVVATGKMQPGTPLVYGPAAQEFPELGMQLPWHKGVQPLGQQMAKTLPRKTPAAGNQGLGRVFRPLGSVKSPSHMTGFRAQQTQGSVPTAGAGSGQFRRQPLTYAASLPEAPQAQAGGTAPKGEGKAAPSQSGYAESPYVQSLPEWARDFLRDSFEPTKQTQTAQAKPGVQPVQGQPGGSQARAQGQPAGQMIWTAPGYTGATARMTHKKKPEPQETPPLRFSDAEIKRMASQVYTIIQDRLKRDQRRLGL